MTDTLVIYSFYFLALAHIVSLATYINSMLYHRGSKNFPYVLLDIPKHIFTLLLVCFIIYLIWGTTKPLKPPSNEQLGVLATVWGIQVLIISLMSVVSRMYREYREHKENQRHKKEPGIKV